MTPASLIAWRERLHLTVVAASAALCCGRRSIQSWEAGRTTIPRYIALACAAIAQGIPPVA